jgi:cation:H+ antiporter
MPGIITVVYLLVLILSLFILGKSAEFLITAITRVGLQLKLSQFITGFILLGITTSTPEITVAINSVLAQTPQLSLGNLLGANIVLITLVAGGTAILTRGVTLKAGFQSSLRLAQVGLLIFSPVVVLFDSRLSRLDGLFLLLLYVSYIMYLYRLNSKSSPPLESQFSNHKLLHFLILSFVGLLGVVIASKVVVSSSLALTRVFSVPPVIIGLIVLAIGTNLPEIFIAVTAVRKKHSDLVLGDVLGSAATNTGIIALLGLVAPFDLNFGDSYPITSLFLVASLLLFIAFTRSKNRLAPWEGAFLVGLYVAYLTTEMVTNFLTTP